MWLKTSESVKKILPQPTGRGCGFPPDLHGLLRCSETHGRRKPPRSKLCLESVQNNFLFQKYETAMTCKIGWKKGTFTNQWQSSETHGLWKPPRSKLRPATGLSGRGVWSWRLMQPSPWSQLGEYTLQIFSHREDKQLKSLLQGNSQACSVSFQWNFKKYLNPVSRSCPHSSDYGDWWGRRFFKIVSEAVEK